jgi:hypothetical protein
MINNSSRLRVQECGDIYNVSPMGADMRDIDLEVDWSPPKLGLRFITQHFLFSYAIKK